MTGQTTARPHDPGTTVIFMHIGKTAGYTLSRILRRQYPASRTYHFRASEAQRAYAALGHAGPPARPSRERNLERFAALPLAERARLRLVHGHIVYGVHELIPNPSVYLTILRDPVALVASQYRHVRRWPTHLLHDAVVGAGMSLERYVTSGISLETDNSQTRAIAGDLETPFGECTDAMLETAKRNLDGHFAAVMISEQFDESLIALRRVFGWRRLHYVRANTAPRRERTPLPRSTELLIARQNELDVELYRYARERLAAMLDDPVAAREVARFRRANALYRPVGAVTYTLPKAIHSRVQRLRRRAGAQAADGREREPGVGPDPDAAPREGELGQVLR